MSTEVAEHEAATVPVPGAADLRELLNGLFDRAVVTRDEEAPVLKGRDVHVVSTYVDDTGAVQAVVMCDLVLGNVLGAALALVPVPRVEEAVAAGVVTTDLADNTREVLNVGASLFNTGVAHLKLKDMWTAPEPVGADGIAFLRSPCRRLDVHVEVPGYGEGVVAVLVV